MNTNYKRGQELWGQIKFPVTADLIVDAATKKAKACRVMSGDGNIVANLIDTQEACGMAELINFQEEFANALNNEITELRSHVRELGEYKKKYFELLKKFEEVDQKDTEPANQMVATTGTENYAESPRKGYGRAVRASESDVAFAADRIP